MLLALLLTAAGIAISRLPVGQVLRQLRPLLPMLVGILLLHGWVTTWTTGATVVLRIVVLVLLAALVSLTTPMMAMMDVVERSLRPFERLLGWAGLSVATITLMLVLAVRFIPVLLEQLQDIQNAQRARGMSRPALTLWVPLLVKTLRLADQVTEALDARGYGGD